VYQVLQPSILSALYRNSVLLQWDVYEWIEKLKNGRTYVMQEEGAGRLTMATDEDNVERAGYVVLVDMRLLKWHIVCKLAIVLVQDGSRTNP
jgi:hypothetical protein